MKYNNLMNIASHTREVVLLPSHLCRASFLAALVLITLSFQSCNEHPKGMSALGQDNFADSAISAIHIYKDGQGRKVIEKANTTYDIVEFIDKQDLKKLLVKITKSEKTFADSGNIKNKFIVSVTDINGGKAHWKQDFTGTDLDYSNKVLVIHSEPSNNNEEDTYTQYSLLTGRKLMTYTYGQLMTLIPNTSNKRFFGYLSGESSTMDKPENFATVSYVGSDEVIDKIAIKLKGTDAVPGYTPELKMTADQDAGNSVANDGKNAILGHADRTYSAKDLNNFGMQINYYLPSSSDPLSIILPVKEDHIDLAGATYDNKIFELIKIN